MSTRCAAALLSLVACACTPSGTPFIRVGEPTLTSASTTCPFGLHGTRVAFEDTPAGVDVHLTAWGDVDELRRRARDAAAMYGPGAHRGLGHDGKHESGLHHGLGLARLGMLVRASEEDTADGACIHVEAVDPSERVRVRAALRARADDARVGACP